MTEKSKARKTAQRWLPAIGGVVGVAIGATACYLFVRKDLKMWNVCRITPDQLQGLIDAPESVIAFEKAKVMIGNTTTREFG